MSNSHGGGHGHGGHGGDHPSVEILSQMGYETRDVSIPALRNWLFGFIVFLVFMTGIPYFLYKVVVPTWADQLNAPMRHQRRVPPFPQIQPDPKPDMMVYRSAEDQVLSGQAGMPNEKAAIPIDQAIDQLATEKGIAGVKGDAPAPIDTGYYPGSGTQGMSKSAEATAAPETTPGGVPAAPIIQGAATNPTLKTSAGVGDTAAQKPGEGAPGSVSGSPMPGGAPQGEPSAAANGTSPAPSTSGASAPATPATGAGTKP